MIVGYGTSKGNTRIKIIESTKQVRNIAAIAGLTLPLARELAPFGIRVMSIAPGPFGKVKKVRENRKYSC